MSKPNSAVPLKKKTQSGQLMSNQVKRRVHTRIGIVSVLYFLTPTASAMSAPLNLQQSIDAAMSVYASCILAEYGIRRVR